MSRWALFSANRLRQYRKFFRHPGPGRLALFFVAATLLVFIIADQNATAEGVLFQSPQSPPAEPEPTPVPPEPTPVPPPEPTPEPVEVAPPTEEAPADPIEVEPTEAPLTEEAAIEPQAVEPTATLPPPTEEPTAPPEPGLQAEVAPVEAEPQPVERSREREAVTEAEGERNFILDRAELIDTVAVSGAYVWLCCGFGLLLLAPLFMILLYVRGRSGALQDEGF